MTPFWLLLLLTTPLGTPESAEAWGVSTVPSESECRPYIEKALKERSPQEAVDTTQSEQATLPTTTDQEGSIEETEEALTKESKEDESQAEDAEESTETKEVTETESVEETEKEETAASGETFAESAETQEGTSGEEETKTDDTAESREGSEEVKEEEAADQPSLEDGSESTEASDKVEATSSESVDDPLAGDQLADSPDDSTTEDKSIEKETKSGENLEETKTEYTSEEGDATGEVSEEKLENKTEESVEKAEESEEAATSVEDQAGNESLESPGGEVTDSVEVTDSLEVTNITNPSLSAETTETEESKDSVEDAGETTEASWEEAVNETKDSEETIETLTASTEETTEEDQKSKEDITKSAESKEEITETNESQEQQTETAEEVLQDVPSEAVTESTEAAEETISGSSEEKENITETVTEATAAEEGVQESAEVIEADANAQENATAEEAVKESEPTVEDQLTLEFDIPAVRRPRDHITDILRLNPESAETELLLAKTIDSTLKELKRLYDSAIKPLEILFKYRDLSNRHFGDPEIFSKPLILFMGPWSGGKSTILNYLLDNEFKTSSLRTGAEPSPAYFNLLMWGEREEVLDGTQLAADWTFSGLQKFGQGLLDRLRGLRLNNPLLEKVNVVEIPGILEIRKQVERLFPFNDACQWFIDRADIIFLVYDPSKLDVGPETEAILDQLKGREYQTRIILNKADQVKPEELMRVQGTLIWNISPLMSSSEPPVMYSTSLWSLPYEQGAPSRLLHAQEKAFLRDLRHAIDRRVENKIASARRFAVRVRNHAKMVDCYLTTYYNHKSFFGNRKKVADDIIEHPQNYHIYEGLSTLTNISRYDLPDPEVYRDFFRLNPLYDFQRLSDTCTYFRGCPINRLDVAISYDLPELVGKYRKQAEKVLEAAEAKQAAKS